jgi:hypothetical protein
LQIDGNVFKWFTAASGTAGNTISFTQAMTLTADGNLGVGVTNPVNKLALPNATYIAFKDTSGNESMAINGTSSNALAFLTNGAEKARIDSSGNFFVGGSSGSGRSNFFVADNAAFQIAGRFTNGTNADFLINIKSSVTQIGPSTATPLAFATSDTERARIDSSGNLLVGTTSQPLLTARGAFVTTGNTFAGVFVNDTFNYAPVVCWNKATANNNNFIEFGTETSFTTRGLISYNRAGGLTVYATTSDYRAKDISGPVTGSGELIDSIPVYMGKMKWAEQERPMFIAHETPAYAHTGEKDAVDENGNPKYQQMDASALIPVMWAEIQSLRQRLSAANL